MVGGVCRLLERGASVCARLIDSEADCEEIVQEVFCRLLAAEPPNGDGRSALDKDRRQFSALFFTSVRNLCIDRLRRRRIQPAPSAIADDVPDQEIEHPLVAGELRERVRTAITRLPESWRDALLLRIDGGLSYEQIAEALRCSKPQVRTWIFRARRQLAQQLSGLWGE